jgi:hypothetical protein
MTISLGLVTASGAPDFAMDGEHAKTARMINVHANKPELFMKTHFLNVASRG